MHDIRNKDVFQEIRRNTELIEESEELQLIFVSSGGHTINVYDMTGQNVDVFSVGDFSKNYINREEFEAGVQQYKERIKEEE